MVPLLHGWLLLSLESSATMSLAQRDSAWTAHFKLIPFPCFPYVCTQSGCFIILSQLESIYFPVNLDFTFSLPPQMSWCRGQVSLGQWLRSVHQKPQPRVGIQWMFGKWRNQQRELPFCLSSWARSAQLSMIWSPTCLAGGELGTGCTVTFPKPSPQHFWRSGARLQI